MTGRALLLAVLLYVTLDLSLAEMPGAFVFDAAGSVESTHGARTRGAEPVLSESVSPAETSTTPPSPAPAVAPSTATRPVARTVRLVGVLPRDVLAPPASDDAH